MKIEIQWYIFHFIQILLFQFYATTRLSQLSWKLLYNRNPMIAKNILPRNRQLHQKWIDRIIGSISLLLLSIGMIQNQFNIYWTGKSLSLFGFLFTGLILDLSQVKKFEKKIPLKVKREASLEKRFFGKIIPLWAWIFLFMISLSSAIFQESLKSKLFIIFSIIIILIVAYFTEKRVKLPTTTSNDEDYRKLEIYTVFFIGACLPIFFFLKLFFRDTFNFYAWESLFSLTPLIAFFLFFKSRPYQSIMQ